MRAAPKHHRSHRDQPVISKSAPEPGGPKAIHSLLGTWLCATLPAKAADWLNARCRETSNGAPTHLFYASYSAIPRHVERRQLSLSDDDIARVRTLRPGWQPQHWTLDQAARAYLLLSLPASDPDIYARTLRVLAACAEVRELVALYRSLPLLPHPEHLLALGVEGVRSNMSAVFEAVALDNPYPAERFGELAWNQLVLKAVFIGSPLHRIQGLDRRANRVLARMLVDFARERRAAGRDITHELWRCVGPYARGDILTELEHALTGTDALQRQAAALALSQSPDPRAHRLLCEHPDLHDQIRSSSLDWSTLHTAAESA